jgi:hypothetical protein
MRPLRSRTFSVKVSLVLTMHIQSKDSFEPTRWQAPQIQPRIRFFLDKTG